jgi:hypothetical protein
MSSSSSGISAEARVAAYDWQALKGDLDTYGCAVLPRLLLPGECRAIAALYADESHFRSHIHMARHGFGKGEYRYFKYPLAFPIQVAILLSEPGEDFTGGEFVLTEQRPRMQSRAEVVPLRQGDAVTFAVHNRPI